MIQDSIYKDACNIFGILLVNEVISMVETSSVSDIHLMMENSNDQIGIDIVEYLYYS